MTSNTLNHRHASAMYKAASQYIETFTKDETEIEYINGISNDAADLNAIGDLISKGKLKKAATTAWKLDTIVREFIPDPVWKRLESF